MEKTTNIMMARNIHRERDTYRGYGCSLSVISRTTNKMPTKRKLVVASPNKKVESYRSKM
jgi:hypothetical protein